MKLNSKGKDKKGKCKIRVVEPCQGFGTLTGFDFKLI